MTTAYITYTGKGDPVGEKFRKPIRPFYDLDAAVKSAGELSDVYEVDIENPDANGRGMCTVIRKVEKEPMKEDANAEHYHGLSGWVSDYKKARKFGNVKLAKEIKSNIEGAIKKHNLDATKVWGEDPDQPKEPMKEHKAAVSGLAFLVESELEKAQVVIAAKGILDKLQKMAEDLAKTEADDIMPMLDSMRLTFGPELTDSFNDVATAKLRQTMEAVKGAKEAITREVGRLEANVNGEQTNDMGMGEEPAADDGMGDLGADDGMGGLDGDADMGAPEGDLGDEAPMPGEDEEVPNPADDLDAAFDDAAQDTTAAGRAKKESIERNVKALSESKNPDRLVFETFRRTLKESRDVVRAAKAVANAFAIDFADVVAIVKEGKTFKDEKGKTDKNKDRAQDRKDKKRDRPSDIDEGKTFKDEKGKTDKNKDRSEDRAAKARDNKKPWEKDDLEEGKTFKDEKGKKNENPFKDRDEARKAKKKGQDEELEEAAFGGKQAPAFGKRKPDPLAKVPNDHADMKAKSTKKVAEATKKPPFSR